MHERWAWLRYDPTHPFLPKFAMWLTHSPTAPRPIKQIAAPAWLPPGWVAFRRLFSRGLGSAEDFYVSPTGARCLSEQETQLQQKQKQEIWWKHTARGQAARTLSKRFSFDQNSDVCQACGTGGDLLCCDTCSTAYHLRCAALERFPTQKVWSCPICTCVGAECEADRCTIWSSCRLGGVRGAQRVQGVVLRISARKDVPKFKRGECLLHYGEDRGHTPSGRQQCRCIRGHTPRSPPVPSTAMV